MGAYSFSGTAASNTSIDGIGIAGSSSPANLDDALRTLAAADANFVRDLGGAGSVNGTADAITLSLADITTLPTYFDGMVVGFRATGTNTGATTINIDSVGIKKVRKSVAGVETALSAGNIVSGNYYLLVYRSAWDTAAGAFQIVDLNANASSPLTASDIGVSVAAYSAAYVKSDTTATFTKGYNATAYAAGTKSSGTFTPLPSDGNFQTATNGGSHTLGVPASTCSIVIQYTNNSSAGTISTSGYTKVTGSTITTTNGDDFLMFITVVGSFSHLHVQALQ